jgi:hypothetical protein
MALTKFDTHPAVVNIPSRSSGSDHWIEWHKTLKSAMGRKQANMLWLKAWELRAGKGSAASTMNLRSYMSGQGVEIDKTTIESVKDTVGGFFDFIGDIFKTGVWIAMGLVLMVVIGAGVAVFNLVKKPLQSVKAITGK